MYYKDLETIPGAKQQYDVQKKKESAERLSNLAKRKKSKKKDTKE